MLDMFKKDDSIAVIFMLGQSAKICKFTYVLS